MAKRDRPNLDKVQIERRRRLVIQWHIEGISRHDIVFLLSIQDPPINADVATVNADITATKKDWLTTYRKKWDDYMSEEIYRMTQLEKNIMEDYYNSGKQILVDEYEKDDKGKIRVKKVIKNSARDHRHVGALISVKVLKLKALQAIATKKEVNPKNILKELETMTDQELADLASRLQDEDSASLESESESENEFDLEEDPEFEAL
jgi:hypothetical protein